MRCVHQSADLKDFTRAIPNKLGGNFEEKQSYFFEVLPGVFRLTYPLIIDLI